MANPSDAQAKRLIKFYNEAEREILKECGNILLGGEIYKAQERVNQIKKDLLGGSRQWVEEAIPDSYNRGIEQADSLIPKDQESIADFEQIHIKTISSICAGAYSRLAYVISTVGRRVDDIFNAVELQNVKSSVIGNQEALDNIIENIKKDLAEKGITGFVDKAGKNWNMSSYAEVLAQEATIQSFRQGTINRALEAGETLGIISDGQSDHTCKACLKWRGQIVSLVGNVPGYPTLNEAKEDGLFHPNCIHIVSIFIEQ